MTIKCVMCGSPITQGILCPGCDRPRRFRLPTGETSASVSGASATLVAPVVDAFPKAPVIPFPVESVSPAITSLANVLVAAGAAAIVLAPDRTVKFVTEEIKKLLSVTQADLATTKQIEQLTGIQIGDLAKPSSATLRIRHRNIFFSTVPLSGGASGAVLIFRSDTDAHPAFGAFLRETVLTPLRALRDSIVAGGERKDFILSDAVATLDQMLSSLEMAPGVEEAPPQANPPKIVEIIQTVATRFKPFAEVKNIRLQVSVPKLEERFRDHDQLADALGVLLDNALHYVPAGGQVVVGVRAMEHKGNPILLFFVMDNGPHVPEHLRHVIFESGFVWNPNGAERAGRGLFKVRAFAASHGGSVWAEAKTGKACTFFLRVARDAAR